MHQVQEVLESWSEGSNRGKGQNVYVSSPKKRTHRAWQSRQRAGEDSACVEPGENSVRLKVTVRRVIVAVFEFDDEVCLLSEACCLGPRSSCCVPTPAEGAGYPSPL